MHAVFSIKQSVACLSSIFSLTVKFSYFEEQRF